jgi:membrane associated rhomboid family serine protease
MGWQDRQYNIEGERGGPTFIFPIPTWLTFALIVACVAIFILEAVTGSGGAGASPLVLWGRLTFTDRLAFREPWRWITYQYLHENGSHIFWNMLSIYFIVPALERIWGWQWTLGLYTAGGVFAGICYGLLTVLWPSIGFDEGLIGASGAILAVLGGVAALDPHGQVLAMMIIPMTWRVIALLYGILFLFLIIGDRSHSDAAHLGGLVFGWVGCAYGTRFGGRAMRSYRTGKARRDRQLEIAEQEAIDRILQKVSEHGMQSLTSAERRTLKRATERQRRIDAQYARGKR